MAKVTAPLLSFRARGSIGSVLTYRHRGRTNCVYKFAVPTDRRTMAQAAVRDEVKDLLRRWLASAEEMREWFWVFAQEEGMPPFALWTREGWYQHCAGMPD
jgi:hypothetical protein